MTVPDRYTCEEVFRRLNDYLDRELTAAEIRLVEEHLDACEGCASEYRFEAAVLEDLRRKLRSVRLPPGLAARIARTIERAAGGGDRAE
jgi:anti-sigma factor (TIGR02949 family)